MALKTTLFLALMVAFYCHKKVFCNELEPEFSINHADDDKDLPDDTCENSRKRRDVNNGELINTEILNKTAIEDYLKVIAKAIPVMRGHVESINGKLYFPPKLFFSNSEDEKPDFAEKGNIGGSGDDTEPKKNVDNFSRFREPNPEGMWNKNRMYDFQNYEENTNENPTNLDTPFPLFLHNGQETNRNDKMGSHIHSDIYKKIPNSDINANIKPEIINANDFETQNTLSKESGTNCDDYCLNKYFGYIPQQQMSSCHSHFIPKPLVINFNGDCSMHRKHHLKNKPHLKAEPWHAMFQY